MSGNRDLPVRDKMNEIEANRDRLRRLSEERIEQGLSPFPSAEELAKKGKRDEPVEPVVENEQLTLFDVEELGL